MKTDYSRSVSMRCSTCGVTDFEFEDEDSPVRCTGCGRIFAREELIRENGAKIESEVEQIGAQIIGDLQKDLKKMFKNFK